MCVNMSSKQLIMRCFPVPSKLSSAICGVGTPTSGACLSERRQRKQHHLVVVQCCRDGSSNKNSSTTLLTDQQLHNSNTATITPSVVPPLRIEDCDARQLSEVLTVVKSCTSALDHVTISSPGFFSRGGVGMRGMVGGGKNDKHMELKAKTQQYDGSQPECDDYSSQHVPYPLLHLVERTEGDFVPNNMVYHQIRKWQEGLEQEMRRCQDGGGEEEETSSIRDWLSTLCTTLPARDAVGLSVCETTMGNIDSSPSTAQRLEDETTAMMMRSAEELNVDRVAKFRMNNYSPVDDDDKVYFFPHVVSLTCCVAFATRHFMVLVNLAPVVPFHLMVVPIRVMRSIHALNEEEVRDWGNVVRLCFHVLDAVRGLQYDDDDDDDSQNKAGCGDTRLFERRHEQEINNNNNNNRSIIKGSYSVAIQQGKWSGQTVPHLHTHVIPFEQGSVLAGEPEEGDEEDQRRKPRRTAAEMRQECELLRPLFSSFSQRK